MTTKHTAPQELIMYLCISCGWFEPFCPFQPNGHRIGPDGPTCPGEIVTARYARIDENGGQ